MMYSHSSMWLLTLVLLHGFLPLISCENLLSEILKCSSLRASVKSYQDLAENEQFLDRICSSQKKFYQCVSEILNSWDMKQITMLHLGMLENQWFLKELCSDESTWRKRYLENAQCINKQETGFCTSPDFVGALADYPDLSIRCSIRDKIANCVATVILVNCGNEAAHLFIRLMSLATDDDFICSTLGDQTKPVSSYEPQKNAQDENISEYFITDRTGLVAELESKPQNPSLSDFKLPAESEDQEDVQDLDTPETDSLRDEVTLDKIDSIFSVLHDNAEGTRTCHKGSCEEISLDSSTSEGVSVSGFVEEGEFDTKDQDSVSDVSEAVQNEVFDSEEVYSVSDVSESVESEVFDSKDVESVSGVSEVFHDTETSTHLYEHAYDRSDIPETNSDLQSFNYDAESDLEAGIYNAINQKLQDSTLNQIDDFKGLTPNSMEEIESEGQTSSVDLNVRASEKVPESLENINDLDDTILQEVFITTPTTDHFSQDGNNEYDRKNLESSHAFKTSEQNHISELRNSDEEKISTYWEDIDFLRMKNVTCSWITTANYKVFLCGIIAQQEDSSSPLSTNAESEANIDITKELNTSPDVSENELSDNLNLKDSKLEYSEGENYEESKNKSDTNSGIASTEVTRRTGANLHCALRKASLTLVPNEQDEIYNQSQENCEATDIKLGTATKIPSCRFGTMTTSQVYGPPLEHYEYVDQDYEDQEFEDYEVDDAVDFAHPNSENLVMALDAQDEQVELKNTPYERIEGGATIENEHPEEYASYGNQKLETTFEKKFADELMHIVKSSQESVENPKLNIETYKLSDGSVHMFWKHPFSVPFESVTCGHVNEHDRSLGRSFKCILTPNLTQFPDSTASEDVKETDFQMWQTEDFLQEDLSSRTSERLDIATEPNQNLQLNINTEETEYVTMPLDLEANIKDGKSKYIQYVMLMPQSEVESVDSTYYEPEVKHSHQIEIGANDDTYVIAHGARIYERKDSSVTQNSENSE